jgi:integrase
MAYETVTKITRELLRDDVKPKSKAFEIYDTEVRGFVARVFPSGTISFHVRTKGADGKQVRRSLGVKYPTTNVGDARERARILIGELAKGLDEKANKKREREEEERDKTTLGAFVGGRYGEHIKTHRKSHQKPEMCLKKSFEGLYEKPIHKITKSDIEEWRTKRLKDGLSLASCNRYFAELKVCFSKAVDWGLIPENPARGIKLFRVDNAVIRFLSKEEETRLREKLALHGGYLEPLTLLALNTGLRRGELFDLEWRDIDLSLKNLTVRSAAAKSGKRRDVSLNAEAISVLTAWKGLTRGLQGAYVFPSDSGGRRIDFKKAWRTVIKEAGIENFRFHDTRHTFASNLVMRGVDLYSVSKLLGHADLKMTERYAHLSREHLQNAVDRLNRKDE